MAKGEVNFLYSERALSDRLSKGPSQKGVPLAERVPYLLGLRRAKREGTSDC